MSRLTATRPPNTISDGKHTAMWIRRSFIAIFVCVFIALVAVDWLLLRQNSTYERARQAEIAASGPKVGTVVPPLDGVDVSGAPVSVDHSSAGRPTLLFVFSTECPICTLNWPRWETLARRLDSKRCRLVYANVAGPMGRQFLNEHGLNGVTVLARLDPRTLEAYSLHATPMILVIGPDSRIKRVWLGRLKDNDIPDLEETLGLAGASALSAPPAQPTESQIRGRFAKLLVNQGS